MRKVSLLILVSMLCAAILPMAVSAESVNVLKNGSFEDEFVYGVGKYWGTFNNGGLASYAYHDDTWEKVLYDGEHSQLLELHTKAVGGSNPDRYMGISQVADVVAGQRYMFSFYGMVRSTEGSEIHSSYNYRVQIGFDYNGGTDPEAVTEWTQMDWPEHERLTPGRMQSYAKGVTAQSDKLTVFIRVWKKFPTAHEEANINIDAVSLVGPAPAARAATTETGAETTAAMPETGGGYALPVAGIILAGVAITLTTLRLRRQQG